ncbi:MAG: N-acetyltransferase [Anaerovoracaceae bacterium]
MSETFKNITLENIDDEHLCCAIADKKHQCGVAAKKQWLKDRITEGHVFRKLDEKGKVFIEYAPLEKAWVPIVGENYIYIYCLWVSGSFKGKGYARELLNYCIDDTKPKFSTSVKVNTIDNKELTIYYGVQCPYIPNCIEQVENYCKTNNIGLNLIAVDTLEKAKKLPCIFNNWAVFYDGKFETVHLLNEGYLKKLLSL